MRVLVDIGHPAHVHFFKHAIRLLHQAGHQVMVTSRRKEMAAELLDELHIEHQILSGLGKHGMLSLALELVQRDVALGRVARRFRPHVMAAIGGTFIAHVGAALRIPSLVFYDTENATAQNLITYPLARCVVVPRCYDGWLPRRHLRYPGYHELAYLHPRYFQPDRQRAIAAGADPDRPTFLLRLVSWQANHDVGERGWNEALLEAVMERLSVVGKVVLSAEGELGERFEPLRYRGAFADIHHFMAACSMVVGESATMASEAAVLGVPAIYAAHTRRGYTDEQESRYGLVRNVRVLETGAMMEALEAQLALDAQQRQARRARLLEECVDVTRFIVTCIETGGSHPQALQDLDAAAP